MTANRESIDSLIKMIKTLPIEERRHFYEISRDHVHYNVFKREYVGRPEYVEIMEALQSVDYGRV